MLQIRDINVNIRIGMLDLGLFTQHNNHGSKRLNEKQGTLYLLRELLGKQEPLLEYTATGKPYLVNGPRISISHSHNRLAIITNQVAETGIDIELKRDKVLRIRHKFLNGEEAAFCGDDVEKLITVWAAKESLYKVNGRKGLDFSKDLSVQLSGENSLKGTIRKGEETKQYLLQTEDLGDYVLVYVLDEI